MIRKVLLGLAVSSLFVVLPALGNTGALQAPHLWILIVLGVLGSVLQPGYNPLTIMTRKGDKGTGAQIIWSVYLTQVAGVTEAVYLRYPRSVQWDVATTFAVATAVLGLALRTWAFLTLGDLFTMHIAVRAEQPVIQNGPYRIVRHPSYLGAFILYVSTLVLLHAWFSLAAAMIILPLAFLRRIHHEEDLLEHRLGRAYETYRLRVRRTLLPGVW